MAGKAKIVDEVWDDDRVKSFLGYNSYDTVTNYDFQLLSRAYKYMRIDDFGRFLVYFVAAGYNLDACNQEGKTLAQIIKTHRFGAEFITQLALAKQHSAAHQQAKMATNPP